MNRSILLRKGLIWTAGALGALFVLAAGLAAAFEAGYFRGPLLRFIASHVGRAIKVDGDLHLHVFALHPRVAAERVTIGNPSWVPPGTTAVIGRLSFGIELPWFHRSLGIDRLEMEDAAMTLSRDDRGLANWQWTDPRVTDDTLLPRDAVVQTAAAVALGVLLTPLASALAFVDPGLSKDADCGALMTQDKTLRQEKPASPPSR